MTSATGEQFELRFSSPRCSARAIIRQVAAGLRALWFDGVESVQSHPEHEIPPMGTGLILVPWPNRIRDGRWTLNGEVQQLDLTDPGKGNAIHGLLRNTAYRVLDRDESTIRLAAQIVPQHGYPFLLDTEVAYALTEEGLRVTHTIRNLGTEAAPVAIGAHPFLRVGDTPVSDLVIRIRAACVSPAGNRGLPEPVRPVDDDFDLRDGRRVGDLDLDACYSDLETRDGRVHHSLMAPDGSATELWADADFGYAQVFTPHNFPTESGLAQAVAIEPMTAPPDALNCGDGLRWLAPGDSWTVSWGVRHHAA